jgi:deazaflavin-dependent oxidoreductase (nitroreductase family)
VPSDLLLKTMNGVHRALIKVSGGRIGRSFGGMPVLELTTTGRKTGQPRSVMLTSPVQEGDTYVIVASRGGDDHHPAWFLNLKADPQVQVALDGKPAAPYVAREGTPDERARIWPQITSAYKGYAGYERKTDRVIPIVFLTPAG